MSDSDYGMVLDNVVVACGDILPVFEGKVLLGLRTQKPIQGTWSTIGGRKKPGDSFGDHGTRTLERELGLELKPERFILLPVSPISVVWEWREQEPQEHGCHVEISICAVALTADEAASIRPDHGHDKFEWFDPAGIFLGDRRFHPFIDRMMRDLCDFMAAAGWR